MKHQFGPLLCVLLLSACTTIKSLQTVDTVIPCIGSVGTTKGGVFSKEFKKVGEPKIFGPIEVSLQSTAFTKSTYQSYQKYRENLGKQVSTAFTDSSAMATRFYELHIVDLVGVKQLLNHEKNADLRSYLEDDRSLSMLTGIAFVADPAQKQLLESAQHVSLIREDGHLTLQVQQGMGHTEVRMKSLEVFDFETSGFCWQENKRNRPEIAVLTRNGEGCPRGTEKSADKLDETRQYLKL